MAELCDAALLLRSIPYREHSLICHLLTATHGRLAVLVHAARGSKRHGRQAELASMHRLSLRWKPGRGELAILLGVSREQALLPEPYWLHGQQLTAMANELFRKQGQHGYDELCHAYQVLANYPQASFGLLAAQWTLLMMSGWASELNACWQCGESFAAASERMPMWSSGQLHCSHCRRGSDIDITLLRHILQAQSQPTQPLNDEAARLWQKMRDSVHFHIHHGSP